MIAVFPVIRLLSVATSGPTSYPDTHTYRVKASFLDLSLTSLDGRSIRPWGVTAWLALWPSDEAIVLAQTALSIVAWVALALTVAAGIQRAAPRRILVFLLLLLACTAQVANWDLTILAESVSISSGILALAAFIRFTRVPAWGRGVVFLLAALWFSMTRPNVFLTLLAWALAVLLMGVVLRRQMLLSGVVAGLLVAFSLYGYVYNIPLHDSWRAGLGVSRTVVAYGYPVSRNDPVAEAVLADLRRSDAPRCMIPANPGVVSHHGTTAWVARTVRSCPGMDAWATAHWPRWWSNWLLTHPRHALRIIKTELPASLSPPVWANVFAAVPTPVRSVFFGSTELPQSAVATRTYHSEPLLLWLAAAAVLALLGRGRWRGSTWACDLGLLATVAGTLASAVSSGLLIQTASFRSGSGKRGRRCRDDGELHLARRLRSRPAAWPPVANLERQSGHAQDEPDSHGRLLTIRRPPTRRAPHGACRPSASRPRRPSGRRASAAIREPPHAGLIHPGDDSGSGGVDRHDVDGRTALADRVGGGTDGVAEQHSRCWRLTAVPDLPEPSPQAGKRAGARVVLRGGEVDFDQPHPQVVQRDGRSPGGRCGTTSTRWWRRSSGR